VNANRPNFQTSQIESELWMSHIHWTAGSKRLWNGDKWSKTTKNL